MDCRAAKKTSMITDTRSWIAAVLLIAGCGSQVAPIREYKRSWVGYPVSELKAAEARPSVLDDYKQKIGWTETTYKLANGNWVWVELAWKDCFIHWEVDPNGMIVDSRTEGKSCKWH